MTFSVCEVVAVAGTVEVEPPTAAMYFTCVVDASLVVHCAVAEVLPAVTVGPEERIGAVVSAVVVKV